MFELGETRRPFAGEVPISLALGIDVRPLTPSLSPSDGERVPVRAGEGSSADSPSFHGSGCFSLGRPDALSLGGCQNPLSWELTCGPSPFPSPHPMGRGCPSGRVRGHRLAHLASGARTFLSPAFSRYFHGPL